ncbi:MAG TPA: hypothetical protein VFI37_14295 [Gaiellaceae bacterium]|nr:hypothetical protein [Gaiellaceae bacterium]
MSKHAQKYLGGAFGFALALVWTTTGTGSALTCLAAAGLGAGAVVAVQRGALADLSARATGLWGRLRSGLEARTAPPPRSTRPSRPARPHSPRVAPAKQPATQVAEVSTYGW